MNHGLVVIDDTDSHRTLLETAAQHAAGADADLVLLPMASNESVAAEREAISQVSDAHASTFGTDTTEQRLVHTTKRIAREALADVDADVEYTIVPRIVDGKKEATAILDAADQHDCDHIFMIGTKRSRTGKAIFGSLAQSVMLAFDGQVTVELE